MTTGSNLTSLPGVPDSSQAKPGMAYFEGTGPKGKTCHQCHHRGYQVLHHEGTPREHVTQKAGCAMYRKLSGGVHGPVVQSHWKACKYFEQRGL